MITEQKHTYLSVVERRVLSTVKEWQVVYLWTCQCGESSGGCFSNYTANRDWQEHALSYKIQDLLIDRSNMLDANRKAFEDFGKRET